MFNNTPDETAFYRLCLNREDVGGALTMIQPTLQSYGFKGPPTPVRLAQSGTLVATAPRSTLAMCSRHCIQAYIIPPSVSPHTRLPNTVQQYANVPQISERTLLLPLCAACARR